MDLTEQTGSSSRTGVNKIVRFKRVEHIFVTPAALAIARAVIVNEIDADELFAAIDFVLQAYEAEG